MTIIIGLIIATVFSILFFATERGVYMALAGVFTLLGIFSAFIPIAPNYSEGQRTGDIYKVSEKGLFYKSIEGSMYLGGVVNTKNGIEMERWYFSIPESQFEAKRELIDTLKECANSKSLCTVSYKQWFQKPINIGSRYVVQSVTVN